MLYIIHRVFNGDGFMFSFLLTHLSLGASVSWGGINKSCPATPDSRGIIEEAGTRIGRTRNWLAGKGAECDHLAAGHKQAHTEKTQGKIQKDTIESRIWW